MQTTLLGRQLGGYVSKVHVFIEGLAQEEIDALILLLEAAGVPADEIELVDEVETPTDECQEDVFVFLLTPETIASAAAQEAISKVPNGGRRAICVWPEDALDELPPPAAAKFSYSTVSWDAERLRVAIVDDDTTCFEKPSGEPIPPPETERNECE
jgi:hypothetical protein